MVSMCRERGSVLTLSAMEALVMVSICRHFWSSRALR